MPWRLAVIAHRGRSPPRGAGTRLSGWKRRPTPRPRRPFQKPRLHFSRAWCSGKLPQAQRRPRGPGLQSLLPTRVKALRAARVRPELRDPTQLRARLALLQESSRSHTHLHPGDGSIPLKAQSATEQPPAQSGSVHTLHTHTHTHHRTHTRTTHRPAADLHTHHSTCSPHTDQPQIYTHITVHTHGPHTDQPQTYRHTTVHAHHT